MYFPGAHGNVKYYLFNDQLGMPFAVNNVTGGWEDKRKRELGEKTV